LEWKIKGKGIETRTFFIPINEQPVFRRMGLLKGESHPITEELARKGMYLPSSSGLKGEEIKSTCNVIRGIKKESR
jgi:perosamine synthetase